MFFCNVVDCLFIHVSPSSLTAAVSLALCCHKRHQPIMSLLSKIETTPLMLSALRHCAMMKCVGVTSFK